MPNITVEIVYATAQRQGLYRVQVARGCCVREAVLAHAHQVESDFPQAQVGTAPLGIFGKAVGDDVLLREGDRIEIYRPLLADPKQARRRRIQKKEAVS